MGQQLQHSGLRDNNGYVFTNPDRSPVDPDRISNEFPKLVEAHDLPDLKSDGLRRIHAMLAITEEIHPTFVSQRSRHSCVSVTMDIYRNVLLGMRGEAAVTNKSTELQKLLDEADASINIGALVQLAK